MKLKEILFRLIRAYTPVLHTRILFRQQMGYPLDLRKPVTYNEKLQWLKLFGDQRMMIRCGDKYTVRGFVAERGLAHLLNELHGVYDSPAEIDFSVLPPKFVLKISNASGYNMVCEQATLDDGEVRERLQAWLRKGFGRDSAEPHYARMPARIVCEAYLEDTASGCLRDYKVHCLNGEPVYVAIFEERRQGSYRILRVDFEGRLINPEQVEVPATRLRELVPSPPLMDQLRECSRILSAGTEIVRIDYYIVDSRLVFGEMTFTPGAGFTKNVDLIFQEPAYQPHIDAIPAGHTRPRTSRRFSL